MWCGVVWCSAVYAQFGFHKNMRIHFIVIIIACYDAANYRLCDVCLDNIKLRKIYDHIVSMIQSNTYYRISHLKIDINEMKFYLTDLK